MRDFTPEQRNETIEYAIDPGFVHFRKVEALVGPAIKGFVDAAIHALPPGLPEGLRLTHMRLIYTRALLQWCRAAKVPSLSTMLSTRKAGVFCSVEELAPCPDVATGPRAVALRVDPTSDVRVELRFSVEHLTAPTLRERLEDGGEVAIIGTVIPELQGLVTAEPMVMGSPWVVAANPEALPSAEWYLPELAELRPEEIDQFSRIAAEPLPDSPDEMRHITERAFKACLAKLCGDSAPKDWGGETSDYFAAHLTISARRYTAAFLLKGPGNGFGPMGLPHLGKHQDQILRLAGESADILIVQHCHEISPPVRKYLKMATLQPGQRRRFCIIDGRDSLRILKAYGLYEHAVELSGEERTVRVSSSRRAKR